MGLTLILGAESLLADRAIASLTEGNKNSVLTVFSADTVAPGEIADALAPSLFSEERTIVMREAQDLSADVSEELAQTLSDLDDMTHVIFWHKGGVKGKSLLDKVKKVADRTITCEPLKKESEKSEFIRAEFHRLGRKVNDDAVSALVDSLGGDLRELAGAISQLASDVAGSKIIDGKDVATYQLGRVETTGYDVADAVLDGKQEEALLALRNAIETGTDPVLITSAIASSLRTLAKVSGASRGVKSYELASSLALAPWQIDKARRQLPKWSPSTLAAATVAIAQADADIKGAAADPIHSLERAVIAITGSV
jgi:DNA polymerase III subunit delta